MVDRRQINRNMKRLQHLKTWQLVILLILFGFISATFLRLNNIGMIKIRDAVIQADEKGDNKVIQERLYDLQRYVSSHMNTDLGRGVYLEYSYNRAYQEALTAASVDSNPNGNIYAKAQQVCAPRYTSWSYSYVMCVDNEISKYPSSSNLVSQINIKQELFIHDYNSPIWSPDFAGWSILICVVILIMILARITSVAILKIILRKHSESI
ncbi:MAG TPA: hypothetical protein PLO25_01280 [Candidatus Saccharibacteria bacterium]|nr:hypothetical protein [Candidatus Saccharibacteria bacterium]